MSSMSDSSLDPVKIVQPQKKRSQKTTEQHGSEKPPWDMEILYRAIFDNANDAIFLIDQDKFVVCNSKTLEMFGCTREQIIGKTPYNPFSPPIQPDGRNSRAKASEIITSALRGQPQIFDWRHVRYDGSPFDAQVSLNRLEVSGKVLLQAIVRDVTEQRQAEERLKILFEYAPDAYYMIDLQGRFIEGNIAAEQMVGYKREELIGKSFLKLNLLTPLQIPRAAKLLANGALGQATGPDEFVLNRKDGTKIDVEIRTYPVQIGGQAVVLGIARDITERKKTEEEFKLEKDKLQALMDGINRAGIGIDIVGADYSILFQNETLEQRFGKTDQYPCYKHYMASKEPCEQCPVIEAIRQNRSVTYELQGLDGRDYQIFTAPMPELDGSVSKAIEIVIDITERKKLEEELKYSEEKYKTLIEHVNEIIFMHDPDYILTYVSPQCEKITGYPPQELIGQHWASFATDNPVNELALDILKEARETGKPPIPHQVELRKKDGSAIILEVNDRILRDANGEITSVVGSARDITEHKQAEEEMKKSSIIIDSTTDAVITTDVRGNITLWNKGAEKIYGYQKEEVLGRPINILYKDEDLHVLDSMIKDLLEGQVIPALEVTCIDKNQQDVEILLSLTTIRDADGNVTELVGITKDVTEQKRAEEELLREKAFTDMALDAQSDTFFLFEPATGRALRWNQSFRDITGYTDDEIAKMPAPESYYSQADLERATTFVEKVLKEGIGTIELDLICKDDRKIPTEYRVAVINDDLGEPRYIISIGRDITDRKRAEKALQESEEKYRRVVEDQTEFIVRYLPDGTRTFVNDSYCRYFGISRDEAIGTCFFSLIAEDFHEAVKKKITSATPHDPVSTDEHRVIRPDGNICWNQWTDRAIFDADGKLVEYQAVGQDITDRKLAEETLKEQRDRLQKYLDIAGVMFIVIDTKENVVLVNKKGCEVLGYAESEILGSNWFDNFLPKPRREMVRAVLRKLLAEELKPVEYFENPVLTKGNQERTIAWHNIVLRDQDGNITGTLSSGEDITERKRSEAALIASEQRYRSLFDTSLEGIGLSLGNRVISANKALLDIFGYDSLEEFVKIPLLDHVAPESREMIQAVMQEREHLPLGSTRGFEYRILRKDGEVRDLEASTVRISIEGEVYSHSTFRDITERKKSEKRIKEYQTRLKSLASELSLAEERERRRIAAGLHDDIAQKLAMAKFSLQSLETSISDPELSQSLEKQCKIMEQIVEDARSLTFELSNPVLYQFGLEAAVESHLAERIEGEFGIKCKFVSKEALPALGEDVKVILFQAVRELLANIVKHSKASAIEVSLQTSDAGVKIIVKDNGLGFDPIQAEPQGKKMTGFGLFNIRERLEYLGGTFGIESKPGQGARITLTFPLGADKIGQ